MICLPPDCPWAITELVPIALEALREQEEKKMKFELTQRILGLEPYGLVVLTEAKKAGGGVDLTISVEFGGGLDAASGRQLLEIVLEEIKAGNAQSDD